MGIFSFLFRKPKSKTVTQPQSGKRPPVAAQPRQQPGIQWREGSFPMEVVGESNYQDVLVAICGAHTRHGHEGEYEASIEREPSNLHDPNAVMVKLHGRKVGYLPRDQAERVGEQMRDVGLTAAVCRARVRGGWRTNQYDEGHFGVRLAIPNHGWIDLGVGAEPPTQASIPRKTAERPKAAPSGPLRGHRIALMGTSDDDRIAHELAAAGAKIMAAVGASTTLLVIVAEQPFDVGIRKSANFRRAEEMIAEGSRIRIISISEARRMIGKSASQ
ncbi:HIRAN domain-containing protein [Aurantimonas marina]|uniref:HIRAN domain-containing protein n=1 Tax=Aurantimonas marina TaxID=2780508 RepID=UPI0019CFE714|nr:HIRAN domain-containing protein [Aurantimonas marina]